MLIGHSGLLAVLLGVVAMGLISPGGTSTMEPHGLAPPTGPGLSGGAPPPDEGEDDELPGAGDEEDGDEGNGFPPDDGDNKPAAA